MITITCPFLPSSLLLSQSAPPPRPPHYHLHLQYRLSACRGTVASPHWFSETFGFSEESFDKTRNWADEGYTSDKRCKSQQIPLDAHIDSIDMQDVDRFILGALGIYEFTGPPFSHESGEKFNFADGVLESKAAETVEGAHTLKRR